MLLRTAATNGEGGGLWNLDGEKKVSRACRARLAG